VVFWAGAPFFARAWQSLANRSLNMWTLIGLGTGSAWAYSAVATLVPGAIPDAFREGGEINVYFEAAAAIVKAGAKIDPEVAIQRMIDDGFEAARGPQADT